MARRSRFRVRKGTQAWNSRGPDLLRIKEHAHKQLAKVLGPAEKLTRPFVRIGDGPWRAARNKAGVMDRFKDWGGAGETFVVAEKIDGAMKVRAGVKRERVRIRSLDNCSPATSLAWSLVAHQFPKADFLGGYVYKQISGTSMWSDHAWGTAFDVGGVANDKLTDWVARMGSSRDMVYDYALGSRNGRVVSAATPDFNLELSGASSSHLTHVHVSVVDHDGRKPPRPGGVW